MSYLILAAVCLLVGFFTGRRGLKKAVADARAASQAVASAVKSA